MKYAEGTTVTVDKSRTEIERTLSRFGATSFMYGWQEGAAAVGFVVRGRQVRFLLPMPDRGARQFTHTPTGLRRSPGPAEAAYDQSIRQRWRALNLVIKAKLEAVESGIVTFEQEFAVHTVLPSGATVGEWLLPQIAESYESGGMPALLPGVQPAIERSAR